MSDIYSNAASWFPENVCVKPHQNTTRPPPSIFRPSNGPTLLWNNSEVARKYLDAVRLSNFDLQNLTFNVNFLYRPILSGNIKGQ